MDIRLTVKAEEVLEYLENLIDEASENVATFEYYDGTTFKLADFRKMDPWDAFLYGIATGKKDQLELLYALIQQKIRQL
jgi:hypothetical protein